MVELYYLPHLTIATPASNVEIYSDYESLPSVVLSWVFLTNTQTRQDQQQHGHTCGGNHTELRAEDRVAPWSDHPGVLAGSENVGDLREKRPEEKKMEQEAEGDSAGGRHDPPRQGWMNRRPFHPIFLLVLSVYMTGDFL